MNSVPVVLGSFFTGFSMLGSSVVLVALETGINLQIGPEVFRFELDDRFETILRIPAWIGFVLSALAFLVLAFTCIRRKNIRASLITTTVLLIGVAIVETIIWGYCIAEDIHIAQIMAMILLGGPAATFGALMGAITFTCEQRKFVEPETEGDYNYDNNLKLSSELEETTPHQNRKSDTIMSPIYVV